MTRHPRPVPPLAPSPSGLPVLGNLVEFLRDPIEAPTRWARECGDFVRMRAPGPPTYMLFSPELVGELLIKNEAGTRKSPITRGMSCITGESIVTISGEPWKRRRRLLDPIFRKEPLARHASIVQSQARSYADRWLGVEGFDAHGQCLEFMFDVLLKALTEHDLGPDRDILRRGFEVFWADFSSREFVMLTALTRGEPYKHWTTPRRWRQKRLLTEFSRIIGDLTRRARQAPGDDLISTLLPSLHQPGGLDERELRDDVITVILAAQETTAMGLTMALDLLARHPEAADRIAAEANTLPDITDANLDDLKLLPYTDAVVREALRLYPPLWGVAREAIESFKLGDHQVEPGTLLVASAWVIQRDPRWWGADALAFRPERWLEAHERPRLAWFPFGAGPHTCIGMRLAMTEMVLALATWMRHLQLHPLASPPELTMAVTVRPKHGVPLRATPRTPT